MGGCRQPGRRRAATVRSAARGSEHVVPPHLPPGDRTGHPILGSSKNAGNGRTGAVVPVTVSFFGCVAFQHQYLVPLCSRTSYIIIGHDCVISLAWASTLLSCGTILAYTYVWFLRCKKAVGEELLLGEYHEDFFQLLLALSASCYRLSCGRGYWKAALSIFPLRPNAPINLKKGYLPLPSLSVSLNY